MFCPYCGHFLERNNLDRCPHCASPLQARVEGSTAPVEPQPTTGAPAEQAATPADQPIQSSADEQAITPATPVNIQPNIVISPITPVTPTNGGGGDHATAGYPEPSTPNTSEHTPEPPTVSDGAAPTIPVYSDYAPYYASARSHPLQRQVVGASRRKNQAPLIIMSVVTLIALIAAGVFGYDALAGKANGAALNRSQATATPIATTAPTTTPAATPSPTAILHSTVIFQDPLTTNTYGWEVNPPNCYFAADGYHVSNNFVCLAPITQTLTDITVSVQAQQVSGPDNVPYGLTLRHIQNGSYYDFDVRSDGYWEFVEHQAGTLSKLQDYTFSSAIIEGVGQTNALRVVMRGATFDCYVNNMMVGEITDTTFASGDVGVFGGPNETVFTNFLVTAP